MIRFAKFALSKNHKMMTHCGFVGGDNVIAQITDSEFKQGRKVVSIWIMCFPLKINPCLAPAIKAVL